MNLLRNLIALVLLCCVASAADVSYKRTEDVVYGRKFGTALTLDVFTPDEGRNGCAAIFMVSGGFFSSHEAINASWYREFMNRGYTVFAVVHGSQPRFIIPEITEDIHRAVRFIRYNAEKYGIQKDKFAIFGGSAGGHLTLTMATQGKPGSGGKDPINAESSAVQVAACFFPPTDLLNYGKEGEDAVGVGILKAFQPAFGPRTETAESRQTYGKEISPIYYLTDKTPPCLIIHGDADKLVPYQQAQSFIDKAASLGVKTKLINRPGMEHGWKKMEEDLVIFADWFDLHLRGIKKESPPQ